MKLLLDTHALIWWFAGESMSDRARLAVADPGNQVVVSAVSAYEMSLKYKLGKLEEASVLLRDFERVVASQGFSSLPVSLRHGLAAGALDLGPKDPFDRLLVAQALVEDLVLVSNEAVFDGFGVNRLW